jgi:acyl carrier protein
VNDAELRAVVRSALGEIAPEADLASLPTDAELREELELDSMDFLNFVTALHEQTGVDVPEREYPHLVSIDACVEYLARRLGA